MHVLGTAVAAGPLLVHIGVVSGRNFPVLGPDDGMALAEGVTYRLPTRFNINIGDYF